MMKHATICRTNRAQQALRNHQNDPGSDCNEPNRQRDSFDVVDSANETEALNNNEYNSPNLTGNWLTNTRFTSSCNSSPTPSLMTSPTSKFAQLSSAPSSVFSSPCKSSTPLNTTAQPTVYRHASESTIKVFAQTLSQEVEYITLYLNAQTKSQQIIRTLLKKFRLKHRDPNLFYLTLERWIRKDGIKFKSVMLLGDDACPLQLQQCCSNPPHNDIKFTLQMRAGALIKIFCSDVCPETKYKCLSLSSQTTVEETIGLMLHCLNLTIDCESKQSKHQSNETITQNSSAIDHHHHYHHRQASSPGSTGSSSSSASSTSSSSGIESDLMNQNVCLSKTFEASQHQQADLRLDANSRTQSITSISSISNVSNTSNSQAFSDHYCLVIECGNTNYKRVLTFDDILVEVYQGLMDEAREQTKHTTPVTNKSGSNLSGESIEQPDSWFVIKLKRRDDLNHQSVKFASPRQNMLLPPIPPSMAQFNNANDLQQFVLTAQIEVNNHQRKLSGTSVTMNRTQGLNEHKGSEIPSIKSGAQLSTAATIATARSRPVNGHQKQMSAIVSGGCDKMPPPPETLVWLPPIRPRRRNLSNASSTFGRPQSGLSTGLSCNRRRYDPAQLADDLNQLNLNASASCHAQAELAEQACNMSKNQTPVIEQTGSSTSIEMRNQE